MAVGKPKGAPMNTDRLPSIPAEEYHTASRSGRTCRADCWPTAGTSTVALAKADANPTDLCRRKTCGEIAEGKSPALALGRQLGRAGSQEPGDVARLRSVGCRAGAARNYAVADLTEKAKRGCVSPASDGRGGRGPGACCPASFCRMPRRRGTGTTPWQI